MINQGWLCPKCNSAHAPDVKTCPSGGTFMGIPVNPVKVHEHGDCACSPGYEAFGFCGTDCPRRMYFTSKTDNKLTVGVAR